MERSAECLLTGLRNWSAELLADCWRHDRCGENKDRRWPTAFSRLECELYWGVLEGYSRNGPRLIPGLALDDRPFHSLHSSASEKPAKSPTEKKNALVSFDSWPLTLITLFRHGTGTS